MPRAQKTTTARLTDLFMDLDGGEMETILDVFKTLHARRTRQTPNPRTPRTTPTTTLGVVHSGKPAVKPPKSKKVKPLAPPVEPLDAPAEPAEA